MTATISAVIFFIVFCHCDGNYGGNYDDSGGCGNDYHGGIAVFFCSGLVCVG